MTHRQDIPASASAQGLPPLSAAERAALVTGSHADPFSVLGPHGGGVRALLPGARRVVLCRPGQVDIELEPEDAGIDGSGLFHANVPGLQPGHPKAYELRIDWPDAQEQGFDPYAFGPLIDEATLEAHARGDWRAVAALAPVLMEQDGVRGLRCAVWAPNARRVALVGDFNGWDPRRHAMRLRHRAGVWEFFLPGICPGQAYKYAILGQDATLHWKADPLARRTQLPPATASVIDEPTVPVWTDEAWMRERAARQQADAPLAIYEVHAGSWVRPEQDACLWDQLGDRLPAYAKAMGFTHIELLPITEYPFGGSWGYQPLSMFAPTARHGSPAAFARFIDRCHAADLGVILDWVPAHFPNDPHGLAHFDGSALYEYADPREGYHPDWHSGVYNLGRQEVSAMLLASAQHWLSHFHLDGLRVDAVASMLYRDYSRAQGQWVPNRYGGRENLESIDFLRALTDSVRARGDGSLTIAEESTAWPGVTAPTAAGGLGFDYKWNMGWMHDTLRYMQHDPIHRRHHHSDLSFGLSYAFAERFILPLSHDEVVHGKGTLATRMAGDPAQRLDALKAYLGFMWSHPGKKLLFMGGEIGQWREWNHDDSVDWNLLDDPAHRSVQQLVAQLNRLYAQWPALHVGDADPQGFSWVIGDDSDNSVLAFERHAPSGTPVLVLCNFTPVTRFGYQVGACREGSWRICLDTRTGERPNDESTRMNTHQTPLHGRSHALSLTLPGLSTLWLIPEQPETP